ncbi:necrosis inducing-like protein NPP1 type [Phytophthora cinnamomi]|uniref:necrosis inducing-like protein NPP1 type n=1 Tax=Phytophthora cinnamomi TaxID=4785 RepID=UPI003559ECEE|nr:necrosis inducing-like protein NPP1 type [Phytophthora cinnamomi]
MNLIALLLAAVASFVAVQAERKVYTRINHDEVQPFPQAKPTTDSEKAAVKYKPQLHVSYGCQPYPAIQADGAVSFRHEIFFASNRVIHFGLAGSIIECVPY